MPTFTAPIKKQRIFKKVYSLPVRSPSWASLDSIDQFWAEIVDDEHFRDSILSPELKLFFETASDGIADILLQEVLLDVGKVSRFLATVPYDDAVGGSPDLIRITVDDLLPYFRIKRFLGGTPDEFLLLERREDIDRQCEEVEFDPLS
jgi:hypothetical protein